MLIGLPIEITLILAICFQEIIFPARICQEQAYPKILNRRTAYNHLGANNVITGSISARICEG
jgi:hypothetical protein